MFNLFRLRIVQLQPLIRESWLVAYPMSLIMFFMFIMGITDVYVAGKFGTEVQAAYGIAFQLYFIYGIVANAITVGTVSIIARLFTAKDNDQFDLFLRTSQVLSFILGVSFSLFGLLTAPLVINLFNVPAGVKVLVLPLTYLYFIFLPFNYILINSNGILRACKSIQKSLHTMAGVCLLNVILVFCMAFQTNLGFKGIALATGISTVVGSLFNIKYVGRLYKHKPVFTWSAASEIFKIGWPIGLLQVFWQMGIVALIGILGSLPRNTVEVIAAFSNGLKIESAIFLVAFAFNMANAVIVANLIGEKKKVDAYRAGLVTAGLGAFLVGLASIVVIGYAPLISKVLSDNPRVVFECSRYLVVSLIAEPLMAWGVILGGALSGAGDTKIVMTITAVSIWFVRIPVGYYAAHHLNLGALGVWWAMNASLLVQTILIWKRYSAKKWLASA